MKIKVTVNRTGFSTKDIEVEVPEKDKNGHIRTEYDLKNIAHELALERARDYSFSEHDAEYVAEYINLGDRK